MAVPCFGSPCLAVLGALLIVATCQPPSLSDETLLLEFKSTFTNGDAVLSGWNASTPACQWEGLTCNAEGRVESM
jgi:hypothetical protein